MTVLTSFFGLLVFMKLPSVLQRSFKNGSFSIADALETETCKKTFTHTIHQLTEIGHVFAAIILYVSSFFLTCP